mgnify:CR=1 FL=1
MIDPITLLAVAATSVINYTIKYAKEKFVESAMSGIVGNKADAIADRLLGNSFKKIKEIWNDQEVPANADLINCLENAKLDATAYLMEAVIQKLKALHNISNDVAFKLEYEMLQDLFPAWLRGQKKTAIKTIEPKNDDSAFERIKLLLTASESKTAQGIKDKLKNALKENLVKELEDGMYTKLSPTFLSVLHEGWVEGKQHLDWYAILAILFSKSLNKPENRETREVFELRLLSDITTGIYEIQITAQRINYLLDESLVPLKGLIEEKWGNVEHWLKAVDKKVEGIEAVLVKLDQLIAGKGHLDFPIFSNLNQKIAASREEVTRKKAELRLYEQELSANPGSAAAIKAIEITSRELLAIQEQVNTQKQQLADTTQIVKQQAKYLEQIEWETATERLKNVKEMFLKGNFMEVDRLLNYYGRSEEIEKIIADKIRYGAALLSRADEEVFLALSCLYKTSDELRFEKAEKHFGYSLELFPNYRNHLEYAQFLQSIYENKSAILHYRSAIEHLKKEDVEKKAGIYNNMGIVFKNMNLPKQAENAYISAITLRDNLTKTQKKDSQFADLAQTYNNFGNLLSEHGFGQDALKCFKEAVRILEELVARDDIYLADLAHTLSNFGGAYIRLTRLEEGEARLHAALGIFKKLAALDERYLSMVALMLCNLNAANNSFNPQVYNNYVEAGKIYKHMAEKDPITYLPKLAEVYYAQGLFLFQSNKTDEADNKCLQALAIYDSLGERYHIIYGHDLISLYRLLSRLHKANIDKAAGYYQQALDICYKLFQKGDDVFELSFAIAILLHQMFAGDKKRAFHFLVVCASIVHAYQKHPSYIPATNELNKYLEEYNTDMQSLVKEQGM